VNASGLIELVASGIPRLDYYTSGGTAGCPALLVEPAATNGAPNVGYLRGPGLATASGGPTITTGSTDFLAPDGTSGSITKYVGGAASGAVQNAFYTGFAPTISAAGAYTFSLFVKAGATNPLNFCALQFTQYSGGTGTATSYFSLASGTALTSGATIQNYGNGWYRLISPPFTIAAGDLTGNVLFNLAEGNNDITWPASGALNLTAYAWGAQIEAGSVATSYIPTNTATVTRNADLINISGAVSGCIGQTEGTIYVEFTWTRKNGIFRIDDGTNNNTIALDYINDGAQRFRINGSNAGFVNVATPNFLLNTTYKVACAYKSTDSTMYINGAPIASSNGSFTFNGTLSRILVSDAANLLVPAMKLSSFALYTTRLTNAELAALTTL
jgi:hypothetical protein